MASGPGKGYRQGLTLPQLLKMFPDDDVARRWFEAQIWPDGAHCPHCGSVNVQCGIKHPTMTHRCRDCPKRRMFSLKTGTVMQGSPLGYQHLGDRDLPGHDEPQGRVVDEAAPGSRHQPEVGLVSGAPASARHGRSTKARSSARSRPTRRTWAASERTCRARSGRRMTGARPARRQDGIVAGVKDRRTNKVSAAVVDGQLDAMDAAILRRGPSGRRMPRSTPTSTGPIAGTCRFFEHETINHTRRRVCPRRRRHPGHRELLVDAQASAHGHLPQDQPEASWTAMSTEFMPAATTTASSDTLDQMGEYRARGMMGRQAQSTLT